MRINFFYYTVLIFIFCLIELTLAADYGQYQPSHYSENKQVVLINWYNEEGIKRLSQATAKQDFYQLAHHFQPQINPLYCGIASSVVVLNAMRKPIDGVPSQSALEIQGPAVWGNHSVPFPAYSQTTFLNEITDHVKPKAVIGLQNITPENTFDSSQFDPGLTLTQLKNVLETYDACVDLYYAKHPMKKGIKIFRQQLKSVLNDKHQFIIVNFKGKTVGASTGGHISPLAAYDEISDSVLVLDVAGHKNPWYWVPVSHLYQAMHTKDKDQYRGWLVIRDAV